MEAFQTSQKFTKMHQYLAQTEEPFNGTQQHYIKILSSITVFIYHEHQPASISCTYIGSFSKNSFTSCNIL